MDFQNLEKRIIYLKGVQSGIIQGSNPNVSKYKMQIDFEINTLEKQFQQAQQAQLVKEKSNLIKKDIKIKAIEIEDEVEQVEEEDKVQQVEEEEKKEFLHQNDLFQFKEVSKKINSLKDQIFHNNNNIKLLNRNKTYQNTIKAQNIFKQNNFIQLQIQQNQLLYDMLYLKINNYALYESTYKKSSTLNTSNKSTIYGKEKKEEVPIKSILKKSITPSKENQIKKNIQININEKSNQIHLLPEQENKKINKSIQFIKKKEYKQHPLNNPVQIYKEKEKDLDSNDTELMKEFQSTLGSLQKLLM